MWIESALAAPGGTLLNLNPDIVVESTQLPQPWCPIMTEDGKIEAYPCQPRLTRVECMDLPAIRRRSRHPGSPAQPFGRVVPRRPPMSIPELRPSVRTSENSRRHPPESWNPPTQLTPPIPPVSSPHPPVIA